MGIKDAIGTVIAGKNLSFDEATAVFNEIMEGKATDAQIAGFIVALRLKGETLDEITAAAAVMREKATRVVPSSKDLLVDTCGTGGDMSDTFNVSTAAAFIAAGAGARVAKHGNRSVSSRCGSADVLEALGVFIGASPEIMKECLDDIGVCFLFAPALHKAMKYAIGPRREIGIRTIFNILGPLTNPSLASAQLLGVFSPDITEPLSMVLRNLGTQKAYVVHGMEGLDEISLYGKTQVSELSNGSITTYYVTPEDFGLCRTGHDKIKGGTPQENAVIIRDILKGIKGPKRDIVLLNAAFAIAASGVVTKPEEGYLRACESLDSGAAYEKLEKLIDRTGRKA